MHAHQSVTKLALEIATVIIFVILVGFGPSLIDCNAECMAASIESLDRSRE